MNLLLTLTTLAAPAAAEVQLPDLALNLRLEAPITTWDEAVPLGNGLLGGLLWGQGSLLRLSLDRGDLWDERPANGVPWEDFNYATMIRLAGEQKIGELNAIFDRPYGDPHPTKIPAGRLEIALAPGQALKAFELDLATAEGRAELVDGGRIETFFSAAQPVALVRLPGPAPQALSLLPPASLKHLGYPEAQGGGDAETQWFLQEAADGLQYCVCVGRRPVEGGTLLAVTVTSTRDSDEPRGLAVERVRAALAEGYAKLAAPHRAWWAAFWSKSRVDVPEADILRHYYLVQYFYGAASRLGAPPMPLQGVWTADSGGLPPWKGDYHNDLNTQMTYMAYQASGRFEEGRSFLEFLWERLPRFRRFAREFYGAPGASVPGVMTAAGEPLGGWGHYSLSPTMSAWLGHLFYLHWRYTADEQFLRERAWPWCREIGECLLALLKPGPDGRLTLPLSTSPEIHNNSQRAWLTPLTNYDLASLKMLFLALTEMERAMGEPAAAATWTEAADGLGGFHTRPEGVLKLSPDEDLAESHRHLSNLMGIHPFNLTTVDGGERDRQVIEASTKQWDELGTAAWCGYSFSWMSCLRARTGHAEAAVRNLDLYVKAFILRNGFHANGDQLNAGFSNFTYRPFTLEGNFLASQAVHEMLLQSWSPRPGSGEAGIIRLFPATPWRWHEASFDDLRAEGGHRVSARRENNGTTWFRIVAGSDGVVRLRDNFGGRQPKWNRQQVDKVGDNYEVRLKTGETLEASLSKPDRVPAPPADAAEPLAIVRRFIKPNTLPLRIGADSNGQNRFHGDLARASVFARALTTEEIARLADPAAGRPAALPDCLVALDFESLTDGQLFNDGAVRLPARIVGQGELIEAGDPLPGRALRLQGHGYVEIPHDPALDCLEGVALEAWICPSQPGNGRIIDKSPAGAATAYLLDMHPGNALRLIFRDPHVMFDAKLPVAKWSHVASTVDGKTGACALFLNGRQVAP